MSSTRRENIRCECGGLFRRRVLREYDFTAFAGMDIPITLKSVSGLKCSACAGEALDGETIESVLGAVSLLIIKMPFRLTGTLARYLRRELGLTQRELADRLSVDRVTVAKWETGDAAISPSHDLNLRAAVFAKACTRPLRVLSASILETGSTLGQVRTEPPAKPNPMVINEFSGHRRSAAG